MFSLGAAIFVLFTLLPASAEVAMPSFQHQVTPTSWGYRSKSGSPRTKEIVSFAVVPEASSFSTSPASNPQNGAATPILATASATITYLSLLAYFDRPRGYLSIPNPEASLLIQQSRVPSAGLGLFVLNSFPVGTILGTYPGVLRPAASFYDGKCQQFPQAVNYSWRFTDNAFVIDPTDEKGEIQQYCTGGSSEVPLSNLVFGTLFQFLKVPTTLARINEPPRGVGGCNVSAREDLEEREVVFELCRDVVAGEELFMDYGLGYDRSGYGSSG